MRELVTKFIRMFSLAAGALLALSVQAADYPAPKEADWVARDFRFHTGETLPEVRLHYTTVGAPSGEPVLLLHGTAGSGATLLTKDFAGELFGRPARALSQVQLRRHGAGAISPRDRGPGHQAPAPGAGQLDGRHADLDLGREVPRRHGRARAHGLPTDRHVGPQLDAAQDARRRDPKRLGLERRQLR